MLLKAAGALLVIAGGAAWSAGGVARLKSRARNLGQLAASLELLKSEICDRRTPLPEILRLLQGETSGTVSRFYANLSQEMKDLGKDTFAGLWRRAILSTPDMLLTPEEELAMAQLGYSLGRYDAMYQKSAIELTREKMSGYARKAKEECERDWKMQAFCGIAASLIAVIMML